MKKLEDILIHVSAKSIHGSVEKSIDALTFDSRSVKPSTLFVAIKGTETDGHQYIDRLFLKVQMLLFAKNYPVSYLQRLLMF